MRSIEWRATTSFSEHRIGYFYVKCTAVKVNGNDISYTVSYSETYINRISCSNEMRMKNRMRRWFQSKEKFCWFILTRIQFPYNALHMPFRSNYEIRPVNVPIENRFPQHEVAAEKLSTSIPFCWAHQMGNLMENCWWKFSSPHQPNWDLILIVITLSCHITLSPRWPLFKANICLAIFTIYFALNHYSKYYQTENSSGHIK